MSVIELFLELEFVFMQVAYLVDIQHETYYVHCYFYDYADYHYYYYYYYLYDYCYYCYCY